MLSLPSLLSSASSGTSFSSGVTLLIAALLFSPLISGCASGPPVTTTYQENRNRTVYETESMRLSNVRMSSSYSAPPRFYAVVSGKCEGRNCSPSSYNMRFVVDKDTPLEMGERKLTIFVDGNHFDFPPPDQDRTDRTVRVSGIITSVQLTPEQLRQIARSSNVHGTMSGIPFQLSKRSREPIVELLVRTNVASPSSSTESSR